MFARSDSRFATEKTNEEIHVNFTSERRSISRQQEESDEMRFGNFYRKSFFLFCLTWIYRWNRWKRVLFYKCKLGLALRYSADMFINMLKTKLNGFLQNGFKYRKISQLFEEFPRKSETNAFKSFICRRENFTAVRSFASKNCNSWQQYMSYKSSFLGSIISLF